MPWTFANNRPIYEQLIEQVSLRIIDQVYPPGSKLPSVRELAAEAQVNPNTMQRALTEMEKTGLLYAQRTSGRFITEDLSLIAACRLELANSELQRFLSRMAQLGYDRQSTLLLIEQKVDEIREVITNQEKE